LGLTKRCRPFRARFIDSHKPSSCELGLCCQPVGLRFITHLCFSPERATSTSPERAESNSREVPL